jgi:ectoine hydroxylase-related dioxygenase (phytanoyl-CoA dioxygenase family)
MEYNFNQALKEIDDNGYFVIPNALTKVETNNLKIMLERDHVKYSPHYANSSTTGHGLNNKTFEKVVYNMHNKDINYLPYLNHSSYMPLIEKLLKVGSYENNEPIHLLNISARCPKAGSPQQQLHLDSNLPGKNSYPLIMVVILMLDDFNEENGTTRLVPGSHKRDYYADNGITYKDEVLLKASAGSVLVFNGAMWHGGSSKTLTDSRWGIVLGFGRWFIKPSFDFSANTPKHIFKELTTEQKDLLGFNTKPPLDEFVRMTRKSTKAEWIGQTYQLPK